MPRTEVRGEQVGPLSLTTEVTGTLPVANGGTGSATLTNNAIILGAGTGAVGNLLPGAAGNVPVSNGTSWTSAPVPAQVRRVVTLTAASNVYTPNADTTDRALITNPAAAFTVAAPSGTAVDARQIVFRIKATTAVGITWATGATGAYLASGNAALPTTTVANKTIIAGFEYDAAAGRYVCMMTDTIGY